MKNLNSVLWGLVLVLLGVIFALNALDITNIKQTKNFIEIMLSEEQTKMINVQELFMETIEIGRMFRFSARGKKVIITLDTVKLEKHFVYYLILLLQILERTMKIKG